MAAEVVGGAFLSSFLGVVFDRLSSPEITNLIKNKKLDHKLLQRLETTLFAVQAVLSDAEQKQIKDLAVKKWLDHLKHAVYLADDILDQVSTKVAARSDSRNFLSRYLNLQDGEIVTKMEEIIETLESIVKHKEILGLKESAKENMSWRTPSTSLVEGSKIYGRDEDKEAIINLLLDDDDDNEGKISVIPTVGMGGVGKTTLAQLVYNDDKLEENFDFKAWVCVSEEFNVLKVTKTVIEAITSTSCNIQDLNLLQLDLKETLTKKKFFVVLDDVWSEDYVGWNDLLKPFQYGIKGSKILVTTRSEKVASVVGTISAYKLGPLSDEASWLVFANHAFLSLESRENPALEKIGREIVKKCKGLALAAQTLGGLLRTKYDARSWNTILKCEIWELAEDKSKIIPALRISYHYLPSHLKRCFVYCSLYPKDYHFDRDELILLWMAEDLLQPSKRGKTLEEVGYENFDDLASRSFFQRNSVDDRYFVMHDLMHDLATFFAGDFYFRSDEVGHAADINSKTHHLSYIARDNSPISENLEAFDELIYLRTLLRVNLNRMNRYFREEVPCIPFPGIILSRFEYLRVLSFNSFPLDALPYSIGELIHLRYLDLSETLIKTLPESLSNLYNLQTLKLHGCYKLTMLPSGMQELVNLRHLDIRGTRLEEMPKGMGKLKHLQLLSEYIVGKHEENGIRELGGLTNLHGSLSITKLENVRSSIEALEATMMDKRHISVLTLHWSPDGDFSDSLVERDILDKLRPHMDLESLYINCYRGTIFPEWLGNSSYHNMTKLYLCSCKNCCMLPSLGQLPSLMHLYISSFDGLEIIGAEFYTNDDSCWETPFPSLQYLVFHEMPCWQEWHSFEFGAFPQLKELIVINCPRLRGDLPNHLPALERLDINECEELACSLPKAPIIYALSIHGSNKLDLQELPLSFHSLSIDGGKNFLAILQAQLTCLQSLYISSCSSAISFPRACLPVSLQTLEIYHCKSLEFPMQPQHKLLVSLKIVNSCDSLSSFSMGTFPNLRDLTLKLCENLESLTVSQEVAFQNLVYVSISFCPKFISFPEEGLVAPNMAYFELSKCEKLKSLPPHMNTLFPKLYQLHVDSCADIDWFPEGGLPPNLNSLYISNCEKLLCHLTSFGLHMQSLTALNIHGPCSSFKSFPKEGVMPASLESLILEEFSDLQTLDCKALLRHTSLQLLRITNCPRLENLVGESLPPSLTRLFVEGSKLLGELCQKKDQEIWPKIAHIQSIKVDGRWIC